MLRVGRRPNTGPCRACSRLRADALAAYIAVSGGGAGHDRHAATADTDFHAVADAKTPAFLDDLSFRRRVATLFPNRQHQRDGVQIHFVNTSRGNLTFLRRDLVRVDRMPIVASRLYDSSMADHGDFGPGWKFALDKRIEDGGSGQLVYTEASGASRFGTRSGVEMHGQALLMHLALF